MSTDTTVDIAPSRASSLARCIALLIGFAEAVAFVLFASLMLPGSDPLGAAIGRDITLMMGVPVAALVLPGLYLAWNRRRPGLALTLVLMALPVSAYLWLSA